MKQHYLFIFLIFLSCQNGEQKNSDIDDFNFKTLDLKLDGPLPQGPYLMALYENNKLNNGDWYRAKVFLKNSIIPAEYSDSTIIKYFHRDITFDDIEEVRGINAVVRRDTGYVIFKAFEPNLGKGDSVLRQWKAIIFNPALSDSMVFTVSTEYTIFGR